MNREKRTDNIKERKTLGGYLIRRYLSFSVLLLLAVTLFYNSTGELVIGSDIVERLTAENIIREDYENIRTDVLDDVDGWVEILDSENKVIYTKGQVQREKEVYTQEELMRQCSIQNYMYRKSWKIAGLLTVTYKEQIPAPEYVTTFKTFERDGQTYMGLVHIPYSKLNATILLMNPKGDSGRRLLLATSLGMGGCVLIYLLFLLRYSRTIQKHIGRPNQKLVGGLAKITEGDYGTQIELYAEYEYKEIEKAFNELSMELQRLSLQRDHLGKERKQLLSSIAHDLRTPMTTVQGYSKALLDGIVSGEAKKEYLEAVYRKSLHMNDLITKLLEYSRLENDSYQLEFEKTEFTEFVRQAVIEQYEEFEQQQMELEIRIPETDIYTKIDQTEMTRVILNLMKNARIHNPAGTQVEIEVRQIRDICSFAVWDNGTAISADMKERIFEPFVSGDNSRRRTNGSGLGLSICKKIAERHGGSLQLIERGDGWKGFVVHLPVWGG